VHKFYVSTIPKSIKHGDKSRLIGEHVGLNSSSATFSQVEYNSDLLDGLIVYEILITLSSESE
jgi:hypothetical protein